MTNICFAQTYVIEQLVTFILRLKGPVHTVKTHKSFQRSNWETVTITMELFSQKTRF